ncbi:hypothetical protein E4K72_13320 [Oxalobacteraceae bacterium OM1]|nr:hypothetical protein E4K72_13320 [Oxalobacteraceae bacterium OM1]
MSEQVDPSASVPPANGADADGCAPPPSYATLLANHKGKLAMGAAAMLGLAVFYKWRESRLEQEDPAEYARLQRIRAAVESDDEPPSPG